MQFPLSSQNQNNAFCLKHRLTRANQVYSFPIALSEEIHPAAIFYGTVVPVFVFWVVKVLIVNPFLKIEKERWVSFS